MMVQSLWRRGPLLVLGFPQCLLCAVTTQRGLSLPISSSSQQMAKHRAARQKLALPTSQASSAALWKPCLPPPGDVLCQSFSPSFHRISSCPKEEQRGELSTKTQWSRSEKTTRTHSSLHAQHAAKMLVVPC